MGFRWSLALSIHFLLLYSLFSFSVTNCRLSVNHTKCHEDESYALLKFKESFVISKSASYNPFGYSKIASWNATIDCCSWDGIRCDEHTGNVINIDLSSSHIYGTMDANSSLFHLKHLQSLDLSDNDFNHSRIPSRIGELRQLRYLNLSGANYFGQIPQEVSHLTKLLSLDLCSLFYSPDPVNLLSFNISTLRSLIQNSSNLEIIRLNYVSISSPVPDIFINLTSLKQLSLYSCELYGEFPIGIFHLPSLRSLDLGNNYHLSGKLPNFNSSAQITMLQLTSTSFYGTLPASIGNLKSLKYLLISQCKFLGFIPSTFGNLTELTYLDVGYNNFKGHLSSLLVNLTKLSMLRAGFNEFVTDTISWICKLPGITDLELDFVNIGFDSPLCSANLTQLSVLSLRYTNLSGQFPSWIMNLTSLGYMDLSGNNLQGELELNKFLMLKMLFFVELSLNKLSLISGKNSFNASLSHIQLLGLGSCNLKEFPKFLQNLSELSYLYVSDNNINSFPSWTWGKTSLQRLYASYNSFIGSISPLICNLKSLMHLDLSFNNLSGMVPSCLGSSMQSLQTLVLKGNKLSGPIPQRYMVASSLRMIDLSNNNLHGQLPTELVKCRMLEVIDFSHNQINDSFPCWLGTLPELKVGALGHNHLYGSIRCPATFSFPKLHIIDLSHNQFSGNFPWETIQNWKSMMASNESRLQYELHSNITLSGRVSWWSNGYSYSLTMFNKGSVLVYQNLQELYYLIAIDLSSNKFSGEIPVVMGDLTGLVFLNFSNNMLSGSIPSSLGKLSYLEALDLSFNRLSGNIPLQLEELTYLSYLNVSFNNLSGHIPQHNQFATFQNSSFMGNQGLCGSPLSKKCENDAGSPFIPHSTSDDDDDDDKDSGFFVGFNWKVVLIGYGGGLLAGLALGWTFSQEVFEWLKTVHLSFYFFLKERF
ncbi:receptor-like protein 7 [Vigna umbellata]|uniref:receptor-like protein 7 n=1 Tax=Vigna umbellata TaxID=87088 RepID=UPI001F5F2FD4|nr:receptor-like protein 7 [Vigna umbellata]